MRAPRRFCPGSPGGVDRAGLRDYPFVAINAGKGAFARPQLQAFVGFRGLSDAAPLSRNRREELDSEELVFGLSAEWWL